VKIPAGGPTPEIPHGFPGEQRSVDPSVLLQRMSGIRHRCDLDLLLFFQRHSCALLAAERLAACLGYGIDQVAKSLEGLIAAGLLDRSGKPSHGARLYHLKLNSRPELSSLLSIAVTCEGRRDVMRLLRPESGRGTGHPARVVTVA
jgi:predicted transcriptional regulator